jgi:proteasome lid subunit RPN8/RPN11
MVTSSHCKPQLASHSRRTLTGDALPSWCLPIDPSDGVYFLPYGQFKTLQRRAHEAQRDDQREVAGAVVAFNDRLLGLRFLPNRDRSGGFAIEERHFRKASKAARELRKRVIGTFHSHPISAAVPGSRDLHIARLNSVNLIYDVCGRMARLWRITKRRRRKIAKELRLVIRSHSRLQSP